MTIETPKRTGGSAGPERQRCETRLSKAVEGEGLIGNGPLGAAGGGRCVPCVRGRRCGHNEVLGIRPQRSGLRGRLKIEGPLSKLVPRSWSPRRKVGPLCQTREPEPRQPTNQRERESDAAADETDADERNADAGGSRGDADVDAVGSDDEQLFAAIARCTGCHGGGGAGRGGCCCSGAAGTR